MDKIFFLLLACLTFGACKSSNLITDSRDGQRYHYVEIKDIRWMTENMRYDVAGSKLNPNNPTHFYGRLYNWDQAMQACPKGWHLAHSTTWLSVEKFFISNQDELFAMGKFRGNNAKILKSKEGWDPPGTDSLELNILPAGRADSLEFAFLGKTAFFWTSGSHMWGGKFAEEFAYFRYLNANSLGIEQNHNDKKSNYYSCRCVQVVKGNESEDKN